MKLTKQVLGMARRSPAVPLIGSGDCSAPHPLPPVLFRSQSSQNQTWLPICGRSQLNIAYAGPWCEHCGALDAALCYLLECEQSLRQAGTAHHCRRVGEKIMPFCLLCGGWRAYSKPSVMMGWDRLLAYVRLGQSIPLQILLNWWRFRSILYSIWLLTSRFT